MFPQKNLARKGLILYTAGQFQTQDINECSNLEKTYYGSLSWVYFRVSMIWIELLYCDVTQFLEM